MCVFAPNWKRRCSFAISWLIDRGATHLNIDRLPSQIDLFMLFLKSIGGNNRLKHMGQNDENPMRGWIQEGHGLPYLESHIALRTCSDNPFKPPNVQHPSVRKQTRIMFRALCSYHTHAFKACHGDLLVVKGSVDGPKMPTEPDSQMAVAENDLPVQTEWVGE